jgi:hypothetical protein
MSSAVGVEDEANPMACKFAEKCTGPNGEKLTNSGKWPRVRRCLSAEECALTLSTL